MKMNKKGDLNEKTVNWIIAIAVLILILVGIFYFLFNDQILNWIRDLPGYGYDKKDNPVDFIEEENSLLNYYKVAIVKNGNEIWFCLGGNCNEDMLFKSSLYLEGDESVGKLKVLEGWELDTQIGEISGNRIHIFKEILESNGKLYFDVENSLPSHTYLLNLENAFYISGIIYRGDEVDFDYNKIEETEIVKKSPEDISNYYNDKELKDGEKTNWIKLKENIENSKGEAGWNTGSWNKDDLEYLQYANAYGKIWIRFMDDDLFGKDITPWIEMNYWNKYRSYRRVPRKYIAILDSSEDTRLDDGN